MLGHLYLMAQMMLIIYTIPTELNTLFAETFIIIKDDDCELYMRIRLCVLPSCFFL